MKKASPIFLSIPTEYKGIKFRSKLEASWAEWLDSLRIKWTYESEGFDLNGEWYLPDFWLPEIRTFIEIKGALQGIDKPYIMSTAYPYHEDHWDTQHDSPFFLLGGSLVPSFYNIHDTCGYRLLKCISCGNYSITTISSRYICRSCGKYLSGTPRNSPIITTLEKPWGWGRV